MTQQKMNNMLIHMPDIYVSLDSEYFLCSSAGKFDQERLEFFAHTIYPYWSENRCSLHQLANYVAQFGIELWTAHDADSEKEMTFAFDMVFTQQFPGTLLVQCEIFRKESVH